METPSLLWASLLITFSTSRTAHSLICHRAIVSLLGRCTALAGRDAFDRAAFGTASEFLPPWSLIPDRPCRNFDTIWVSLWLHAGPLSLLPLCGCRKRSCRNSPREPENCCISDRMVSMFAGLVWMEKSIYLCHRLGPRVDILWHNVKIECVMVARRSQNEIRKQIEYVGVWIDLSLRPRQKVDYIVCHDHIWFANLEDANDEGLAGTWSCVFLKFWQLIDKQFSRVSQMLEARFRTFDLQIH